MRVIPIKKFLLLFVISAAAAVVLTALSCRPGPVIRDSRPPAEADRLTRFFSTCEKDIRNAVKVIIDNDMVKNLTHLQRMNAGGRKYYLLERENLTSMIMAVTEGVYTDLILLNRGGTVVYTMTNDDIFGRNAEQGLGGSAVHECFIKSREGAMHIEDVMIFPPVTGGLNMFVSLMNARDEFSRGVFIMQIDIGVVEKILGAESVAIDREGIYRITQERDKILRPCPFFEKIALDGLASGGEKNFIYDNKGYVYSPFQYADLFWIIITPDRLL